MRLLTTVSFAKETKKVELEAELKLISKEPTIGQKKVGDLLRVCVYKFKLPQQQRLLTYRILEKESIKLSAQLVNP